MKQRYLVICIFFFIIALCGCKSPVETDLTLLKPVFLQVPYPFLYNDKSMVGGGDCVHGSLTLEAGYVLGFMPTQEHIDRSKQWLIDRYPNTYRHQVVWMNHVRPLAKGVYGLDVRLRKPSWKELHNELLNNRPVIMVLEGSSGCYGVELLIGLDGPKGVAYLHYPAWSRSWEGTGEAVEVSIETLKELWRASRGEAYVLVLD